MKPTCRFTVLLCLFVFGACSFNEPEIREIEDKKEYLISLEDSPVIISGMLGIPRDSELVVEPGVEFLFEQDARLVAYGGVNIEGTPSNPVVFRPRYEGGSWDVFRVFAEKGRMNLKNVIIEEGKVICSALRVKYENVTITNSQDLVWNDALSRFWLPDSIYIANSTFESNNTGEGLLIHAPGHALVEYNTFTGVPDGTELLNCHDGLVQYNIYHNGDDDAIDLNDCHGVIIQNNVINDYVDNGMELGSDKFGASTKLLVRRNIVFGCNQGIKLKDGSDGLFINNTFHGNKVGIDVKEEPDTHEGSHADVVNCLFYSNTVRDIGYDGVSSVSLSYCLSDTYENDGNNNFIADPLLMDPENLDYRLTEGSPCIDAGDPDSPRDPDGSIADIGARIFLK